MSLPAFQSGASGNTMQPFDKYRGRQLPLFSSRALQPIARRSSIASPPVITLAESSITYNQTEGQKVLDGALTVTDADSINLASATITISAGKQTGDTLVFAGHGGIPAGTYDSGTGVLTITGTASVSTWEAALRLVKFENAETGGATVGTRTISFVVRDSSLSSTPDTMDIVLEAAPAPEDVVIESAYGTFVSSADQGGNHYDRTFGVRLTLTAPSAAVTQIQTQQKNYLEDDSFEGGSEAWLPSQNSSVSTAILDSRVRNNTSGTSANDWGVFNGSLSFVARARFISYGTAGNWTESGLVTCPGKPVGLDVSGAGVSDLTVDWENGIVLGSSIGAGATGSRWMIGPDPANMTANTSTDAGLSLGDRYISRAFTDNGPGPWGGSEGGVYNVDENLNVTLPVASADFAATIDWDIGINCTFTLGRATGHADVQVKQSSNSTWQTGNASASSPAYVSDLTTVGNGTLNLRLQSVSFFGNSNSSIANVTVELPGAITGLTVANPGGTDFSIDWDDESSGYRGHYRIESAPYNDPSNFTILDDATAGSGYTWSSAPAGVYNVRVSARNFYGGGTPAVRENAANVIPDNMGTVGGSESGGDITLSWSAVNYAVSLKIEVDIDGGGYSTLEENWTGNLTGYVHSGLSAGTYTYRVTPRNEKGDGGSATSDPIVVP